MCLDKCRDGRAGSLDMGDHTLGAGSSHAEAHGDGLCHLCVLQRPHTEACYIPANGAGWGAACLSSGAPLSSHATPQLGRVQGASAWGLWYPASQPCAEVPCALASTPTAHGALLEQHTGSWDELGMHTLTTAGQCVL